MVAGLQAEESTTVAKNRAQPVSTSAQAILLSFEGSVEVARAGSQEWEPGRRDQTLGAGDRIRTGENSRATIRLSNQALFKMGELSEVVLPETQADGSETTVLKGVFNFFLRDRPGGVNVRTPTTAAALRGTDFNLQVEPDGRTTLALIDGTVELSNDLGRLELASGEQGIVEPGRPPTKTALLNAVNVIQWCLYYPAILDPAELGLAESERSLLRDSLAEYQAGDLLQALARYPEGRQPRSEAERLYVAGLLLSVGQVEKCEALLPGDFHRSGADALRLLIAAVKFEQRPQGLATQDHATGASLLLAESYYAQSRAGLSEARAAAQSATEVSPEFGFAWVRLAELEFSFGRTGAAKKALEKGFTLAPRNAQALALQGFLLAADNRIKRAIEQFEQAIQIDGALANAWLGRGLCRIQQGDAVGGRQDLQTAAALEPQRALLRSYLGKAYADAGDDARATKELDLARRMDAQDPTPSLYSALLKQRENRVNEAIRDLERSQDLSDNRSVFRSRLLLDQDQAVGSANLASIYLDAGLAEVGMREALRAVAYDYASYSAHLFLANSYDAARDPRQVNLRYETPWLNEYLLANLLAPVGAGVLSPQISQNEYSRLFERNRVGVSSTTEYLSRGDWFEGTSLFGTMNTFSYAVDATCRIENGERPNADLEQLTLSARVKQQITPRDTIYLQAIEYGQDAGDVRQYYDPAQASSALRTSETQDPLLLAGYHHEWQPGIHTLFLGGWLQDTLEVRNPQQQVNLVQKSAAGAPQLTVPIEMDLDYHSELGIYTAELQQLAQTERHTVIGGVRYQNGKFDTQSEQTRPSAYSFFFENPPASQEVSSDFERFSLYGYYQWQVADPLRLLAGVAYDSVTYPVNHRLPPISAADDTTDQVSPKAGLIWTPFDRTTVRGAYARALGGVSFDQSFQLEPSQVAGFAQSFRGLIPESLTGALAVPSFDSYGLSLEHKFPTDTYVGIEGSLLLSEAERRVGVFDLVGLMPPFVVSETPEELDFRERSLAVTAHQLVGDSWSFGAKYRLSEARLEEQFTAIPSAVAPGAHSVTEASMSQVHLTATYNHPRGFFASVQSVWTHQSNDGYEPELAGEDMWQVHVLAGYRFPKRKAEVTVGVLNLTDQDYRLNPLNLYAELPRERTLAVRLRFAF